MEHENFRDRERTSIPENWPALLVRVVDDVSRVIHAEMRLFEANLAASAMSLAKNAFLAMIVLATFVIAEICIVAAAILLLHQWLLSWLLSVGLAGTTTFAAGLVLWYAATRLNKRRLDDMLSSRQARSHEQKD